ncbi:MAG: HAMP domain-containing histidine kinase, partial [Treponemataceae bacterium]|nr:HAMP domain-containing histidine kinase [Treponemataceae bacterium]
AVYTTDSNEILYTNDPFIPFLEDTKGKTKRFYDENYFSDGDMDLLYFAKTLKGEVYNEDTNSYEIEDIRIITAWNMANDLNKKFLRTIPQTIIASLLPTFIISFLLAIFIANITLQPVIDITKAAKKITSSNLDIKLPISNHNDELDDLSETFNELFAHLKKDFERERQFSSDVSHELKTPLAVIQGQANLLSRWGKNDPVQLEKSLEAIKTESKSMKAIIDHLLEISRLESGRIKPQIDKVSIKDMFDRLENEFMHISADLKIKQQIINKNSNDIELMTDPEMFHQILTILMSNSLKYAGNKCTIYLRALLANNEITILVEDNGPGFSESNIPHVFDRFYRGDEAHTRSAGGYGLGLSIAQVLIKALEGEISAGNVADVDSEIWKKRHPHGASMLIQMQKEYNKKDTIPDNETEIVPRRRFG